MRDLARLIRCAIVASGTMKARAISAVVRPPTARSVSGIADAGVSAGWQQRKSRISESSRSDTGGRPAGSRAAAATSRRRRALAAQPIRQPPCRDRRQPRPRVVGHTLGRPLRRRRKQRLLDRVLRVGEAAVTADEGSDDLRRERAQQVLDARHRLHGSMSGPLITGRTWISRAVGRPPGLGAADVLAAISIARSSDSTSTSQ